MNPAVLIPTSTIETASCPYCGAKTSLELPGNYKPVFVYCDGCGTKFIAERLQEGFQVIRVENAPCFSNPDCRELEMGAGDEE